MTLVVQPLTPERWTDLRETIFEARGCSVAPACCWCMYLPLSAARRPASRGRGHAQRARSKAALKALARDDPPPGLLGYRDGVPVGWISLGPRADYAKLARSPTMKAVDEQPVWSIVCFVVPSEYRKQGVARDLLAGAIRWARERGVRLLEAYPVDKSHPSASDAPWFGSKTLFDEAGFEEVARRKPARPIVRLKVAAK